MLPSLSLADEVTLRVKESVFGGSVHVTLAGNPDQPAVVLIHGLGDAASQHWTPTIARLKSEFRVLALDLPGFGQSDKGNHLYSPANYAKVVQQVTSGYLRRPFNLVGHSMGAAVSLSYAAHYPDDLESLTLIDAAGILHRAAYSQHLAALGINTLFAGDDEPARNDLLGWVGDLIGDIESQGLIDPAWILNVPEARQHVLGGDPTPIAGLALVSENYSRIADKVSVPTLILWGEDDPVTPLRTAYVLDAVVPQSELHIVPRAGHSPLWDNPAKSHQLLLDHLRQGNDPESLEQPPSPPTTYRELVYCKDENNRQISGRFGTLVVDNCQSLRITDATLKKIVLSNSTVELLNSVIDSDENAIEVTSSRLTVTATLINSSIGIISSNSRLDIAGTQFLVSKAAVRAKSDSRAVFSLVYKRTGNNKQSILHGAHLLATGEQL